MTSDIKNSAELCDILVDFVGKEYVREEDVRLVKNLILHDEAQLGLEILCDMLKDYQIILRKEDFQRIKTLAQAMGGESSFVWEFLLLMDERTLKPKFALEDEEGWKGIRDDLLLILNDTKPRLSQQDVDNIKEYVDVGEYELALEDFLFCFVTRKVAITKKSFEKLAGLLAMFNYPVVDASKLTFQQE